ncbi:MAG TPA: hypothetical protein VKA21_13430, partial [Candidatus Binatia bacterium]|nr:hypothetical protein [Candidatus Binatia bacterium]
PCGADADCAGAGGSCTPGALQGVPAAGPCCVVGQIATLVASGIAFTGAMPLHDIVFSSTSPTSVTQCNPAPSEIGSCTLTDDPCLD